MASFYCYCTRILQGFAFFLLKTRAFVTKTSMKLPNLNYYERKKQNSGLSSKKKLSWRRPISEGRIENSTYAKLNTILGQNFHVPYNCIMGTWKSQMGRLLLSFKYTQAFNRRPMITLTFNLLTLSDALCRKRETIYY